MKIQRPFLFFFLSVSSGLALAFVLLLLRPELLSPPQGGVVTSWADAVALAEGSVVNIYTSRLTREAGKPLFNNPWVQKYLGDPRTAPRIKRQHNLGSGVVADAQGHILTNHHVIEGADEIFIGTENHPQVRARVVGTDPDTDLAVIQAEDEGRQLPPARLGDSSRLRVGDVVLAIGNPFGIGKTVTQGIVSAIDRQQVGMTTYEDFIQTDAAINRGNSGGALINTAGEVVGINTATLSNPGGSQGIGFAIPINLARQVLRQIIEHGRVIRGWIGASGIDLTPAMAKLLGLPQSTRGVYITGVLENGPAHQAGVRPGDLVVEVNGKPATSARAVINLITATPPGTRLPLTLRRSGEPSPFEVEVKVVERPAPPAEPAT